MIDESTIEGVRNILFDNFAGVNWDDQILEDFQAICRLAAIDVIDWLD